MAYSEEKKEKVFNNIIDRIEKGESLNSILKDADTPSSRTFFKWVDEDENKVKNYARATELRAQALFDQMIEISDTPIIGKTITDDEKNGQTIKRGDMLGHRKLQIDTRKWILSKMNPKKYGDKLDLSSDDGSMSPKPSILTANEETTKEIQNLIENK